MNEQIHNALAIFINQLNKVIDDSIEHSLIEHGVDNTKDFVTREDMDDDYIRLDSHDFISSDDFDTDDCVTYTDFNPDEYIMRSDFEREFTFRPSDYVTHSGLLSFTNQITDPDSEVCKGLIRLIIKEVGQTMLRSETARQFLDSYPALPTTSSSVPSIDGESV